jgi:hypothetical protein
MSRLLTCLAMFVCELAAASTKEAPGGDVAWTAIAKDGRLLYARDDSGNRLPDFSLCGYKRGRAPIPDVPVKETVRPGSKDDRAAIQQAIDRVSMLSPDERGIRGAVLLEAGVYRLSDGVRLPASGVVLRGVGASEGGTELRDTARRKHTLITIAGEESQPRMIGPVRKIIDSYVPVGAVSVTLDSVSGLAPGDAVLVRRPSTFEWIKTIGMHQLANPWNPGERDCIWERVVTGIDGRRLFLDAPITTALETRFGGGSVQKYEWSERIQNCGVENLRGVSETDGTPTDEEHGWIFIGVQRATDCWVRGVAAQKFGYACVAITDNARSISVLDSQCIDPVSQSIGGRRYGFYVDDSQLCLVQGCRTRNDRHQFVTGSNTCGPNAFVDGVSETAKSDAGPHHRWANGILWDSIVLNGGELNVRNRGNSGSGHGWAGANCVFWNCRADGFIVESPPTARNWCIGSVGAIHEGRGFVGSHDPGTFYSHGTNVAPASLFAAQRHDASRAASVYNREYVAGQFGRRGSIVEKSGADPWTYSFHVTPGGKPLSASLSLSIRGREARAAKVFIGDSDRGRSLDDPALRMEWPDASVLCFDVSAELPALESGKLDVTVSKGITVDWAVLEIAVDGTAKSTALGR